jgi:hypothetical protein
LSRTAHWLSVAAIAWILVAVVIADYGGQALGYLRETRPRIATYLILAVALAPSLFLILSPIVARFRRFHWLLADPQPMARLDRLGIELHLPERGVGWFAWDEIGSLVNDRKVGWRGEDVGDLLAPDGGRLVRLPLQLVRFRETWSKQNSLAEAVVSDAT